MPSAMQRCIFTNQPTRPRPVQSTSHQLFGDAKQFGLAARRRDPEGPGRVRRDRTPEHPPRAARPARAPGGRGAAGTGAVGQAASGSMVADTVCTEFAGLRDNETAEQRRPTGQTRPLGDERRRQSRWAAWGRQGSEEAGRASGGLPSGDRKVIRLRGFRTSSYPRPIAAPLEALADLQALADLRSATNCLCGSGDPQFGEQGLHVDPEPLVVAIRRGPDGRLPSWAWAANAGQDGHDDLVSQGEQSRDGSGPLRRHQVAA
jgi:hypothetical protein